MKFFSLFRMLIAGFLLVALGWFVLEEQIEQTVLKNNLSMPFIGAGTKSDPYLIETAEQFASFRDLVNSGNTFEECYFLQVADIDLENYNPWVPIGEFATAYFFDGHYDGGGHIIKNLFCCYDEEVHSSENLGLFGQLGGTVANLGIVNSTIGGSFSGSIASHSYTYTKTSPVIVNCFSLATVSANYRGGGIADNFSTGYIANCWYNGVIDSPWNGGIVSYNATYILNSSSNIKLTNEFYAGLLQESQEYKDEYFYSKSFNVDEVSSTLPLSEKTETYYRKIIELCVDKNIPLEIIVTPYVLSEHEQKIFNKASEIAHEYT